MGDDAAACAKVCDACWAVSGGATGVLSGCSEQAASVKMAMIESE